MIRPPPRSTLFPYPPLFRSRPGRGGHRPHGGEDGREGVGTHPAAHEAADVDGAAQPAHRQEEMEEHTSELQSQSNLVCRLLLEKKKLRVRRPYRPPTRETRI